MLDGPEQHNALLVITVGLAALGALALTSGVFIHYGCEDSVYLSCGLCGGGGLSLLLGMTVGNYTKWRSRR
jgi:hypothetical protein